MYCSGIRDFFDGMDAESFDYVDFEGVTHSELSMTVDLLKQRVPEVVSLLDSFEDNGDSDNSYQDEDDGHAANSRGRRSKAKSRYLYTHVQ